MAAGGRKNSVDATDPALAVFDPNSGPAPIAGLGPPLNPGYLTWAEMKCISDAFCELRIPGPGLCLNCKSNGKEYMYPIEKMYILLHGAKADVAAGLKPSSSPFLIGTCRSCAPKVYNTRTGLCHIKVRSVRNALIAAAALALWVMIPLLFMDY